MNFQLWPYDFTMVRSCSSCQIRTCRGLAGDHGWYASKLVTCYTFGDEYETVTDGTGVIGT